MNFVLYKTNVKKNKEYKKDANIIQKKTKCWYLQTINHVKTHDNSIFFFKKTSPLFKHAALHLLLVIMIEFVGFNISMNAVGAEESAELKVIMANGAVLNKIESELIKKDLIIKVPEIITSEDGTVVRVVNNGNVSILAKPLSLLPTTQDLGEFRVTSMGVRTLTAYNSESSQTDGDPCTTANTFNVCNHGVEDTIAANFLTFGTKVRIPDLFGDRIFIVRDRMNTRYPNRVDIWMINKDDALKFGTRRAEIEIISELQ